MFCLVLLMPGTASAQTTPISSVERINSFDSVIHVSPHNVAEVVETIRYDFGSHSRHGIYRDIPIDYTDSNGDVYRLAVEHKGTTNQDNQAVKAQTSKSGGNMRIRLGDPDKTVTGVQTYKIHYTLRPIVTQKNGLGFLNLDVIGTGWQVPIEQASATLSFDNNVQLANPVCFTGEQGSIEQGCLVQQTNPQKYTASNLSPGEGMTINGSLPAGYVSNYLQPNQKRPLTKEDYIVFAVIGVAVFSTAGVFAVLGLRRLRERKRKNNQTIIPEYEPPKGLTVGEIGHLQDDISSTREITAMLVELAVKGYIKIEQTRPKRLFLKAKYSLHKLKEPKGLTANELSLFNALFDGAIDIVEVDNLNRSTMATTTTQIYDNIKTSLKSKGFYGSFKTEPNIIEKMLDTGNISEEGAKMWAKVEGFKLYLSVVEKDRLQFSDAPDKTPELFSKMLPYAIALGVEKQWAKQFEGIDIQKSADWYSGSYAGLSAMNLADNLSSSFAPVVSSNTSVSSSGGSSGGGFGGGGGGSW